MAVQDPTTNYSWDLPANLGDSGAWGALLRTIIGDDAAGIDAVLKDVSDVADAAMPKAGGVFTGEIDILTARYEIVDLGSSFSGTVNIDLDAGNFFHGTPGGTTTFAFTNVPADFVAILLEVTDGGAETINWPASVEWANGVVPSLTTSGVDLLMFYTYDGGTTWRGAMAMEDIS